MRAEALDFLNAVVSAPSPSGNERPVARLVRDQVEPLAHALVPQAALIVDMGQATDCPDADPTRWGRLMLGEGPAIDRGANSTRVVPDRLERTVDEDGIPHQVHATGSATSTDAREVQVAGAGIAIALLGVPLRYMHTPGEVIGLDDLEATARLMAGFCRRVRPGMGSVQD